MTLFDINDTQEALSIPIIIEWLNPETKRPWYQLSVQNVNLRAFLARLGDLTRVRVGSELLVKDLREPEVNLRPVLENLYGEREKKTWVSRE